MNDTWFFNTESGPTVAKIRKVPEEDPQQLRTYVSTMSILEQEGFPTPDLIAFTDECEALDGRQFSVLKFMEGETLAAIQHRIGRDERASLMRDVGAVVGRLHAMDLPRGTTWFDDAGSPHDTWAEVVDSALREAVDELDQLVDDQRVLVDRAAQRVGALAKRHLVDVCEPRLVHRDLHPENILVSSDGAIQILDFEMVREWDAVYDFVKIDSSLTCGNRRDEACFMEGYLMHVRGDTSLSARLFLYQGLYCLLAAADYLDGNEGHQDWQENLEAWLASNTRQLATPAVDS